MKIYISTSVDKQVIKDLKHRYKDAIKKWKEVGGLKRWSKEFNNKFRLYLPLLSTNAIESKVILELKQKDISVFDYYKGLAIYTAKYWAKKDSELAEKQKTNPKITLPTPEQKAKRALNPKPFSFAKFLTPETLHLFTTDPLRQSSRTVEENSINAADYSVVISRHPIDLISMSTGRTWRSCMTYEHKTYCGITWSGDHDLGNDSVLPGQTAPEGVYSNKTIEDVTQGSLIAYVIKNKDTTIQEPLGRIALKPYVGAAASDVIVVQADVYGPPVKGFKETVEEWIKETMVYKSMKYDMKPNLYKDGLSDSCTIFELVGSDNKDFTKALAICGYTDATTTNIKEKTGLKVYTRQTEYSVVNSRTLPLLEFYVVADPDPGVKLHKTFQDYDYAMPLYITTSLVDDKTYPHVSKNIHDLARIRVCDKEGIELSYLSPKLINVLMGIGTVLGSAVRNSDISYNTMQHNLLLLPLREKEHIADNRDLAVKYATTIDNITVLLNHNHDLIKDPIFERAYINLLRKLSRLNTSRPLSEATRILSILTETEASSLLRKCWSMGIILQPYNKIKSFPDLVLLYKAEVFKDKRITFNNFLSFYVHDDIKNDLPKLLTYFTKNNIVLDKDVYIRVLREVFFDLYVKRPGYTPDKIALKTTIDTLAKALLYRFKTTKDSTLSLKESYNRYFFDTFGIYEVFACIMNPKMRSDFPESTQQVFEELTNYFFKYMLYKGDNTQSRGLPSIMKNLSEYNSEHLKHADKDFDIEKEFSDRYLAHKLKGIPEKINKWLLSEITQVLPRGSNDTKPLQSVFAEVIKAINLTITYADNTLAEISTGHQAIVKGKDSTSLGALFVEERLSLDTIDAVYNNDETKNFPIAKYILEHVRANNINGNGELDNDRPVILGELIEVLVENNKHTIIVDYLVRLLAARFFLFGKDANNNTISNFDALNIWLDITEALDLTSYSTKVNGYVFRRFTLISMLLLEKVVLTGTVPNYAVNLHRSYLNSEAEAKNETLTRYKTYLSTVKKLSPNIETLIKTHMKYKSEHDYIENIVHLGTHSGPSLIHMDIDFTNSLALTSPKTNFGLSISLGKIEDQETKQVISQFLQPS